MRIGRVELAELALAIGTFLLFTVPVLIGSRPLEGGRSAVAIFGGLAVLPLLFARRQPVAAVLAIGLIETLAALSGVRFTIFVSNAGPVLPVAMAVLAARRERRQSLPWAVGVLVVISVAQVIALTRFPLHDQDAIQPLLAVPAWLIGDAIRSRRQFVTSLRRLDAQAAVEAEARIRAEERLSLSRDVHDVVSHALGVIAVRSGVARLLMDTKPDEAHQSLLEIERVSRSALDELRAVLRSTGESSGLGSREQSLADVPALLDGIEGPAVGFIETGQRPDYPPLVEHAVYRIIQEALTNIVRHAAAQRATVRLDHSDELVTVTVSDDGVGPAGTDSGLGLQGMRERAELLGGRLTATVRPTGGFVVQARIPNTGKAIE